MLSDQCERKSVCVCSQLPTIKGKSRQNEESVCGQGTTQLLEQSVQQPKNRTLGLPIPLSLILAYGLQDKNSRDPLEAPPALGVLGWDSALSHHT